jgi:hypothetical protein
MRALRSSIFLSWRALVLRCSRSCSARLTALAFQLSRLRRMRESLFMSAEDQKIQAHERDAEVSLDIARNVNKVAQHVVGRGMDFALFASQCS